MILDIVLAVDYMHKHQPPIIHRDIKPENILCFGGNLKLADFGSSNLKDKVLKDTVCGTPEYLAPEMISKSGHSEKVDVWCIGILLYELIFGKTPFVDLARSSPTKQTDMFNALTDNILVNLHYLEKTSRVPREYQSAGQRSYREVPLQKPRGPDID